MPQVAGSTETDAGEENVIFTGFSSGKEGENSRLEGGRTDLCLHLDFNLQLALSVLVCPRDLLLNTTQHCLTPCTPEGEKRQAQREVDCKLGKQIIET